MNFELSQKVRLKEDVRYLHFGFEYHTAKAGQSGVVHQVSAGTGSILFKFDPVGDMLTNHYFWCPADKLEPSKP